MGDRLAALSDLVTAVRQAFERSRQVTRSLSVTHHTNLQSGALLAAVDPLIRGAGAAFVDACPRLNGHLRMIRRLYGHAYVSYTKYRHNLSHRARLDPYRVVWVDPDRIEYMAPEAELSRYQRMGATVSGDWDLSDRRFTDTDVYRAFETHFEDGQPWEETDFFQNSLRRIREGETMWGSTSRAELEARFDRIDELYRSIRDNGFRTQRELVGEGIEDPLGYSRTTLRARTRNDEVAIDVGRDGELLFEDGRHRLAIAKHLGVEELPAIILKRHSRWVALRDALAEYVDRTGTLPEEYQNHPDLEQLPERR